MKREEVLGIFPDATDEQVDGILNGIGRELNPLKASLASAQSAGKQARAELDEARQQAMASRAALEEANARLAEGMSAEELLAQREREAAERERDFTLKSNALDAKAVLVGCGFFSEEEVASLVERVTSEDAEATRGFAEAIVEMARRQREAAGQAVREEVLGNSPRLEGAGADRPLSKEAFDAMEYGEQQRLVAEDPGILERFSKQ